jgi:hypothetical protein
MKHYFDESFRQLNTAITMPSSAVIGPMMDHVVVLVIGLPPSTPNPCSAQIRPNNATINPTAKPTTKPLLIQGCYWPALQLATTPNHILRIRRSSSTAGFGADDAHAT